MPRSLRLMAMRTCWNTAAPSRAWDWYPPWYWDWY